MADIEANILISAVDKVTAPVRRINAAVDRMTRPIRRVNAAVSRLGNAAGIDKLARGLRGAATAAGNLGSRLAGVVGPLGALGGAASIAGLGKIVTDFATGADETSKFARQIGLSTEALQEYQYAADRQGVSQDLFNSSMVAFSKRLGELRAGTGGLHTMLKKVNPAFAEQLKNAESTEEAFGLMMRALQNVEDPQKRAALAAAAFSRSGVAMTRVAEAGADGLAQLRQDARDLGIVVSTEAGNSAESFVDSMTRFQGSVDGLSKSIGASLLPVLQPLLDRITQWIVANRELIATKIESVVKRLAEWVERIDFIAVTAGIQGFVAWVSRAVEFVGGWDNAIIALVAVMNGGLIAAVIQVGTAFVRLGAIMIANPILAIIAAIAFAVYAIYANWDSIVVWFQGKINAVAAAFDRGFLQGIMEILAQFNPTRLVAEAVNGLVQWIFGVDLFAVGSQWMAGFGDGISQRWSMVTEWLTSAITSLTDWMPDWVKDKLGLDFGGGAVEVPPAPTVPTAMPSPESPAQAVGKRVQERVRKATAAVTGAGAAAATAVAAPAAAAPMAGAQAAPPAISAPAQAGGAASGAGVVNNTPVTVSVSVNGSVEPAAIQRAVEDAVRRALEDAEAAKAADARSSLYD